MLRRLASVEDVEISNVVGDRVAGPVQIVSSAVRGRDGRRLLTLHAALPLRELEKQLAGAAPSGPGRTLVFDEHGDLVAASRPVGDGARRMNPKLVEAEAGSVRDYVAGDSLRVVGSALPFPRLRWTLAVEEDYDVAFAPIAAILQRTVTLNLGIVLALSGLAFAVVASMVRPLHALSDCARRLRDGEEGVALPDVQTADEVGILARSFGEMVQSLTRANEVLEQLAITDGLTKIHNHRFFQDQLGREIKRADRTGTPLALVLVDIDDFKALNDRYGHAAGDGVLEQLASLLVGETRDQDLVARYGGEEFAILAPDDGPRRRADARREAAPRGERSCPSASAPITASRSRSRSGWRSTTATARRSSTRRTARSTPRRAPARTASWRRRRAGLAARRTSPREQADVHPADLAADTVRTSDPLAALVLRKDRQVRRQDRQHVARRWSGSARRLTRGAVHVAGGRGLLDELGLFDERRRDRARRATRRRSRSRCGPRRAARSASSSFCARLGHRVGRARARASRRGPPRCGPRRARDTTSARRLRAAQARLDRDEGLLGRRADPRAGARSRSSRSFRRSASARR